MGFSGGLSSADLFLTIRPCVLCHHVYLTYDLAIAQLQPGRDSHPAAIRVLARFLERHPLLADDLSLDAVGHLLAEDRSQVFGDLRLSAKLEGWILRGSGVDDV